MSFPTYQIPQRHLTFGQSSVKVLKEDDFALDSKSKIGLKDNHCTIILFHTQNTESTKLISIWSEAAASTAGTVFAACDMLVEKKVAEKFVDLHSDVGNPLQPYALQTYPYIIVYQNGWPKAFYNGARTTQNIIDYSLNLACFPQY